MTALQARSEDLRKLAATARPPAFKPKPDAALQAARARAQAALDRLRSHAPPPGGVLMQQFLATLMAGGDEGQELAREIGHRAREELERRRHLFSPLTELLETFRSPQTRGAFRRDVLVPARARQLSSEQIIEHVDRMFPVVHGGRKLLQFAEAKLGPLTIGLGIGGEVGAGAGVEAGIGIAGLRHHCVCVFDTATVAVGTYAEAQVSFQIGVSQGVPEAFFSRGLAIDASLSVAYGVSLEGTISLVPVKVQRPSLDKPYLVEYECVGMGLSVGLGAPGGGVALGITSTRSFTLAGTAG